LRAYLAHYPQGAFSHEAQALLAAGTSKAREVWTPALRHLVLFQPGSFGGNEANARSATLAEANWQARQLCQGFEAAGASRLTRATARAGRWTCTGGTGQTSCSLDGWADCAVQERSWVNDEACGPA
jgi:hypothetical protein